MSEIFSPEHYFLQLLFSLYVLFYIERCERLLQLARKHQLLVANDEVYNFLNWNEKRQDPPQRLYAYDKKSDSNYNQGHVVSMGSFSKFLSPGLRVGWLEAPERILSLVVNR